MTFLYLIVVSFLISAALVRLSIPVAERLDILDHPVGGRLHERPMPLLGGVAMFLALTLVVGAHVLVRMYGAHWIPEALRHWALAPRAEAWRRLIAIGGGAGLFVLIGFVDDLRQTRVGWRLLAEFAGAGVVVAMGVRPTLAHIHPVLVFAITCVWIVGIANAFNLLDGLDGLAGTVAAVATALFLAFMLATGQEVVAALLAATLGTVTGFLVHNWHPARTYMGSAGSLLLGYLLATVPLVSDFMQRGRASLAPVLLPVLILSVPLYDTASVVALRILHGRSPFRSDHNHLAHRLRRLGLRVPQAVKAIALLGVATGSMALMLRDADDRDAFFVLLGTGAMFAVFVLLEQASVSREDELKPVHLYATCRFDEETGGRLESRTVPGRVMMLSPDRVEFCATREDRTAFARLMAAERVASVEVACPADEPPLVFQGAVESLWTDGEGRCFAGFVPVYGDPWARAMAVERIGRILYPKREGHGHRA